MSSSHSQRSVPGRREEPWSHSEGCPAGILGRVQLNVHGEFPALIQGKAVSLGPCGRKKGSKYTYCSNWKGKLEIVLEKSRRCKFESVLRLLIWGVSLWFLAFMGTGFCARLYFCSSLGV